MHLAVRFRSSSPFEHAGKTADLGMGGAFIETSYLPEIGTEVQLLLNSPTAWDALELPGRVAWHRKTPSSGFGVRFSELGPVSASALFELLQSVGFLDGPTRETDARAAAPETADAGVADAKAAASSPSTDDPER